MTRSGFSIIECLVYCALLCLLCIFVFNWVGASHVALAKMQKKSGQILELYAALDSFARDAASAPSDSAVWHKTNEGELIWQAGHESIGWELSNGFLYRSTGTYKSGEWSGLTKSLISKSIKSVRFSLQRNKHNEIIGLACDFGQANRWIRLSNRRIDDKK